MPSITNFNQNIRTSAAQPTPPCSKALARSNATADGWPGFKRDVSEHSARRMSDATSYKILDLRHGQQVGPTFAVGSARIASRDHSRLSRAVWDTKFGPGASISRARAAYPGAAAQTRVVSLAAIRLGSWESARVFKGIICDDTSEFESSLSGRVGVKRFQTAPSILVLMSLAGILASLRDRHSGPPMMGSEGCGGPISRYVLAVRLTAGIRTRNGLASSIVPAGTWLNRVGGIQFSPIAIVHN
jgi:hypothetical protein